MASRSGTRALGGVDQVYQSGSPAMVDSPWTTCRRLRGTVEKNRHERGECKRLLSPLLEIGYMKPQSVGKGNLGTN